MAISIRENYPLQDCNTLSLQQSARYFVEVTTLEELQQALDWCKAQKPVPDFCVIGSGSNIILSGDYAGLVIKNAVKGIRLVADETDYVELEIGAGENWHQLVCYALQKKWYGLENLALIPGTAGAAPVQNIGAYGVELSDFFSSAQVFDCESGQLRVLDKPACLFAYRDSVFKHDARRFVITRVCLRLSKVPKVKITYQALQTYFEQSKIKSITPQHVFDAVVHIRHTRLPDPARLPNVGSFFKNPVVSLSHYQSLLKDYPQLVAYPLEAQDKMKLAAAWLIDQAGWKGVREGRVGVHEHQALVLVNYGGASGKELLQFAGKIRDDVQRRYGITLEIEPVLL